MAKLPLGFQKLPYFNQTVPLLEQHPEGYGDEYGRPLVGQCTEEMMVARLDETAQAGDP